MPGTCGTMGGRGRGKEGVQGKGTRGGKVEGSGAFKRAIGKE